MLDRGRRPVRLTRTQSTKEEKPVSTTVTRDQIEERVFKALEEFGAEPDQINADAEFEAMDVDSLDLVELAQIVEDDYGVQLKGEDMEGVKTVRQAVDLVMSKLS
jgi:acyl carrier protein